MPEYTLTPSQSARLTSDEFDQDDIDSLGWHELRGAAKAAGVDLKPDMDRETVESLLLGRDKPAGWRRRADVDPETAEGE